MSVEVKEIPTSNSTSAPLIPSSPYTKKSINSNLILNTSIQGIQLFSLLTPIYAVTKSLRTSTPTASLETLSTSAKSKSIPLPKYSRFSPTLFLQRVSVGTFIIGGLGGASIGFLLDTIDLGGVKPGGTRGVGWRKGEMRRRDYSIIGGVVGGVSWSINAL